MIPNLKKKFTSTTYQIETKSHYNKKGYPSICKTTRIASKSDGIGPKSPNLYQHSSKAPG